MLIFAEGIINRPVEGDKQAAASAWLGPMVDAGFMQSGYHDAVGNRILMILSAETMNDVERRLADLPVVRDGSVTFHTSHVTALRFT